MSERTKGRREDLRLLTGRGRYAADWSLPDQVHAAFLRSDRAHAEIRSIDIAAAAALTGVLKILTGKDLEAAGYKSPLPTNPGPGKDASELKVPHRPALAYGRVRFVGEPVAVVIAQTEEIAREGADLIVVDYDDLPVATTAEEALAAGAPQLHDSVPGNLAFEFEYGNSGAVEQGFKGAAHIVKVHFEAQRIAGNPMEPKACMAAYDAATDSYDVYMQTQGAADIQKAFAHVTGLVPDRFRIHAHDVGGAFGIRAEVYPENVAILFASQAVGRPVKWVGSRSETFFSDHHGRAAELMGELAVDKDGRFLALRVEWLVNLGAYCSAAGPLINTVAAPRSMAANVYTVPAVYGYHRLVLTNTTPTAPYRGAGRPNVAALWERLVDEAARATGIDRIELRRRNMIARNAFPYATPTGASYDSADPAGLLNKALEAADWNGFSQRQTEARARGRLRGIGCATFIEPSGAVGQEEIVIKFENDGRIMLYSNAGPSGQGYESVYPEVVANVLGLNPDNVITRSSDPAGPMLAGTGSFGSRSLISHGAALFQGALEVVAKGVAIAAEHLEVAPADIEFNNGRYVVKGTDLSVTIAELAKKNAGGSSNPLDTMTKVPVSAAFPSGAHVSEVEIDPDTGVVDIVRYIAVDDCGVIYNHQIVEGQMHGGLVQGIGQVMGEHIVYEKDSGQLLSGSFMDYYMPRADLFGRNRDLELYDLPIPSPANPLGAKGAGEAGATGSVPCLANAVHDALSAVGVRQVAMPYTPSRIWEAIQAASA
ncbi:MAG: xanthine dehydrogenase family protein molybdopterin-binding subunit [Hyphomicrobiaceae bacterium]